MAKDEKLCVAQWSIAVNGLLLIVKLAAGIITGSFGIIAEFIHSSFDLLASVLAYLGIKKAMRPARLRLRRTHTTLQRIYLAQ